MDLHRCGDIGMGRVVSVSDQYVANWKYCGGNGFDSKGTLTTRVRLSTGQVDQVDIIQETLALLNDRLREYVASGCSFDHGIGLL